MTDVAGRKLRSYSLGMKQRLGIAATLLGDPSVIILDEPANGLDPEGIRWIRDFLKHYATQGRTVLVSSHLLSEMALMADDLIVIGKGRLIEQGSVEPVRRQARHVVGAGAQPAARLADGRPRPRRRQGANRRRATTAHGRWLHGCEPGRRRVRPHDRAGG